MSRLRSIQLTLLILFGVSFSCNQVKETPEPDSFLKDDLIHLSVVADSGSATIDILSANKIKADVAVQFDAPKHGSISPLMGTSRFLYKANPGYEGNDTIGYRVCRTGFCKAASIGISVRNNPIPPCRPRYAPAAHDTFYIKVPAGKQIFSSGLFPGDEYCAHNQRQILTYSPEFRAVRFLGDSIRMETTRKFLNNTSLLVLYSNCDTSVRPSSCKVRILKVTIETSPFYCDQIFHVSDRTTPLSSAGSDTIRVGANTFFQAVTSCVNDVDPDFFDIYTTSNLQFRKSAGVFKIYKKPGAPPSGLKAVYYIYRNLRHVADTGRQMVVF